MSSLAQAQDYMVKHLPTKFELDRANGVGGVSDISSPYALHEGRRDQKTDCKAIHAWYHKFYQELAFYIKDK